MYNLEFMKEELVLVEVAPGSFENMVGAGFADYELRRSVPRVIVLPDVSTVISEFGTWERRVEVNVRRGEAEIRLLQGDIYYPSLGFEQRVGRTALWALGDIINDGNYRRKRDYHRMCELFYNTLVSSGLVIFADVYPESGEYAKVEESMGGKFGIVLNEITSGAYWGNKQKLDEVYGRLSGLGVLDEALKTGLFNYAPRIWEVFEKR